MKRRRANAPQVAPPPAPQRTPIPAGDAARKELLERVKEALRALPVYFQSDTNIEGLQSGDLFSLNTLLGGTIELQVVQTLNRLRLLWDPNKIWEDYRFVRSSQSFPDVRLVAKREAGPQIALGLELKGWYLLSREGEPSFRYTATPSACAPYDQLVVVPWHLSNVLAGTPVVYEPYIEQARFAAEYRNYYWQHQRGVATGTGMKHPPGVAPYPAAKARISDKAEADGGGNFGRVARIHGLMDDYVAASLMVLVAGIEARNWISFFRLHAEDRAPEQIATRLETMLREEIKGTTEEEARRALQILRELRQLLT